MAISAVSVASGGISGFSQGTLAGLWFVIGAGIYYGLYQTVASGFGRRWGIRTVIGFAAVLIAAGAAAVAFEGELWAAPLTWLLYGFVLAFLILTAIGGLVSLALGTPGCEFGALWRADPTAPRRPPTGGCADVVHLRDAPDRQVGGSPVRWIVRVSPKRAAGTSARIPAIPKSRLCRSIFRPGPMIAIRNIGTIGPMARLVWTIVSSLLYLEDISGRGRAMARVSQTETAVLGP
jgi:hypothetical protein